METDGSKGPPPATTRTGLPHACESMQKKLRLMLIHFKEIHLGTRPQRAIESSIQIMIMIMIRLTMALAAEIDLEIRMRVPNRDRSHQICCG